MNADWIGTLESLRFDVVRHDPLTAHKEHGTRLAFDVTIDASGQVRMTITHQTGETKKEKRASRAGREYQIFSEQNSVEIINYRLRADDNLGMILNEMEKEIARR